MFRKPQLPEVDRVQLKSWKGIRPGVYILLLLCAAILLAAFALFVLPGLASKTAFVTFRSALPETGVYEDGQYLGSAHSSVYRTTSGKHTYTFTMEGIEVGRTEATVKNRIFFTLFSHKPTTINALIEEKDGLWDKITEDFKEEVQGYSAILTYDSSYNYKPIFSNLAEKAVYFGKDVTDLWLFGALHVTSKEMYEDYLLGRVILESGTTKPVGKELEVVEKTMKDLMVEGKVSVKAADESTSFSFHSTGSFYTYEGGTVTLGKSGDFTAENAMEAPQTITYSSFSMGAKAVTEYEYALFVEANPYWAKSNLNNLIADGCVTEKYLEGITLSTIFNSRKPIRNISPIAALAYCDWMTKTTGVSYRLPTEAEWVVAARSGNGKAYATSLTFVEKDPTSPECMLGQLWEITSDKYLPLSKLSGIFGHEISKDSINYVVKGGSYVNSPDQITEDTVGVVDNRTCSEFLGFRVVIDG